MWLTKHIAKQKNRKRNLSIKMRKNYASVTNENREFSKQANQRNSK